MSRLIDANNIKEAKFNNVPYVKTTPTDSELESYMRGWNDAIDAIAECEPTVDAIEVICCGKCEHWDTADIHSTIHPNCRCKAIVGKLYTDESFYCGMAERRQDG